MDFKLTSHPTQATGQKVPRLIGPLRTVGALRKALKHWPSTFPLDREWRLATYNAGFSSECVAIEFEDEPF